MYLALQCISLIILQSACSSPAVGSLWLHGALGPLAAVEAIPRFRYHSLLSNLGFVLACIGILVAPFAYVMWPRRLLLAVSVLGLVVWWLFGLGFTIHHM
jgi:hypothetical protein